MNGFQKLIAKTFRIRQYAAAKYNTSATSGWRAPTASADAELLGDLTTLINRSWQTYNDNSMIFGAIQGMADQVIGDGLKLQSKIERIRGKGLNLDLNHEVEVKFNNWATNPKWCDIRGKLNFYQMQKLIFINCKVAGGILVRIHTRALRGSPVPLTLELIDIQRLADNLSRTHNPSNGNEIRMGVEIDSDGFPVAYWVLDRHPGDIWGSGNYSPKRILASEILHIFNRDNWRADQTRGLPATTPILITARNIQYFNFYELVKARAQSAISWVRTRLPEINQPVEDEKAQQIDMADGMVYDLLPGEDLKAIDASSPNPNAIEFTKDHQRQIAKGLKVSAYQVTGDLRDANYGSIRVGLLQDQLTFGLERRDITTDFCMPIFRLFMDLGSLSYLKMPGDFEVNKQEKYLKDNWIGTPFPWIDPSKDVKANTELLAADLTTKTKILKAQGIEYEDHAKEKAQEKEIDAKYGITDQAAIAGEPDNPQPDNQGDPNPIPVRAIAEKERSREDDLIAKYIDLNESDFKQWLDTQESQDRELFNSLLLPKV
jgi:lambda family phage portal protein